MQNKTYGRSLAPGSPHYCVAGGRAPLIGLIYCGEEANLLCPETGNWSHVGHPRAQLTPHACTEQCCWVWACWLPATAAVVVFFIIHFYNEGETQSLDLHGAVANLGAPCQLLLRGSSCEPGHLGAGRAGARKGKLVG